MDLRGVVVCLPEASLDDYVSVVEVLIQEGFSTFALPPAEEFADVTMIFGARATFGAVRVSTAEQVHLAADGGAAFVFADVADGGLAEAARARGLQFWGSAMTPSEVRRSVTVCGGALLYPADVVGHAMAPRLRELGLISGVVPLGGVGAYAAGEWLKAGAPAVGVEDTLLGDAFNGGSLSQLRERCGSFISIDRRYAASTADDAASE